MKIIITKRGTGYHAEVEGRTEIFGNGKTSDEALGELIHASAGLFNIQLEYRDKVK
jgi:predicted RNase H-like HicB family nuclease